MKLSGFGETPASNQDGVTGTGIFSLPQHILNPQGMQKSNEEHVTSTEELALDHEFSKRATAPKGNKNWFWSGAEKFLMDKEQKHK